MKKKHTEYYRSLKVKNSKNKYLENSSNYIFIVGMPRSGSTLLENILSLNAEVTDMGEVNFLEESIKEAKEFEDVYDIYEKKLLINLNPLPFTLTKICLIICTVQ